MKITCNLCLLGKENWNLFSFGHCKRGPPLEKRWPTLNWHRGCCRHNFLPFCFFKSLITKELKMEEKEELEGFFLLLHQPLQPEEERAQ